MASFSYQDFLAVFITFGIVIVGYIFWSFNYWKKKNVPHEPPSFPYGNTQSPLRRKNHLYQQLNTFYNKYKENGNRFFGFYFFTKPQLVLIDPELVKHVMAKDFQHFQDRGFYYNEKDDPLSAHLFSIGGTKWRNLRTKLTPTFTSGKMKMMLQTLIECSDQLEAAVENSQNTNGVVDIKECLACFTTDVIGSCAFGLEFNSFNDTNAPFRKYGKKVFTTNKFRSVKTFINQVFPKLSGFLGSRVFAKDVTDFFMDIVKTTVDYREKNNYQRKDFLQILIDLKNNKTIDDEIVEEHDGKHLTIQEVAAQAFVFFLAGFETSSTAMTFSLYEMCMNEEIQDKVRKEINTVLKKYEYKITYEGLMEMTYMGHVIDEALRKYPPVPVLNRRCTKDYQIPDSDIILEQETSVLIPVHSLHHDPDLYPDPEKFDPDRFNDENKSKIVPYTYLPFGEGPRVCIGLRFGIMQAKVGLTVLLKNFKFKMSSKTKLPLKIDPNVFILQTIGTLYLDAEKTTN